MAAHKSRYLHKDMRWPNRRHGRDNHIYPCWALRLRSLVRCSSGGRRRTVDIVGSVVDPPFFDKVTAGRRKNIYQDVVAGADTFGRVEKLWRYDEHTVCRG